MFVEIRRCVYGHELEGYKHANEQGDLEMVGGSHEERQGILGTYGARVSQSAVICRTETRGTGFSACLQRCQLA